MFFRHRSDRTRVHDEHNQAKPEFGTASAGRAVVIVYERSDSIFRSTGVYGADNGSLTIDAARMKKFGGKNVTVALARFRIETRTIGGVTVKFLVLSESSIDMFIVRTS